MRASQPNARDSDRVAFIETNGASFLLTLGRAAGAKERSDKVQWVIGNCPIDYHNAVFAADLTEEETDKTILESLASMRALDVPGTWHVGPSMHPPTLGERLVAAGFEHDGDELGMAADLHTLPTALPIIPDFSVEPVANEHDLTAWVETLGSGFGEGPTEARWIGEMYRRMGYAHEGPWRHYLGKLRGEPVATATSFTAAGSVGIYFVFTVPRARRRGIGAAMTLAPLLVAKEAGQQVGVLNASKQGAPVYRRLGFVELCKVGIYSWRPHKR